MAKPNYSFEKRQRELQKKQKKEEKLAARRAAANKPAEAPSDDVTDGPAVAQGAEPAAPAGSA